MLINKSACEKTYISFRASYELTGWGEGVFTIMWRQVLSAEPAVITMRAPMKTAPDSGNRVEAATPPSTPRPARVHRKAENTLRGPCHNKKLTRPVLVIFSALVVYPVVFLIVLHTSEIHKYEMRHRICFKYGLTISRFGGIICEY